MWLCEHWYDTPNSKWYNMDNFEFMEMGKEEVKIMDNNNQTIVLHPDELKIVAEKGNYVIWRKGVGKVLNKEATDCRIKEKARTIKVPRNIQNPKRNRRAQCLNGY